MTESKPTEYRTVILRQANPKSPAELVLSNGGGSTIIILRPSQLKAIAREAVTMVLR